VELLFVAHGWRVNPHLPKAQPLLIKDDQGQCADGNYDLQFALYSTANGSGSFLLNTTSTSDVTVSNGLFTVLLDFQLSPFLTGQPRWLQIGVRTNGSVAPYALLVPLLQLTSVPYAITASNLSGTLQSSQLSGTLPQALLSGTYGNPLTLNNAANQFNGSFTGNLTGNAATASSTASFSGSLNGDVMGTQGATVVAKVDGQTAAAVANTVIEVNNATSADTPNTLVERDAGGSFGALNMRLDGNLNLPFTSSSAGIIYSGGITFMHAFGAENFFAGLAAGNLTLSGEGNTGSGYGALDNNTSGNDNTADGTLAPYNNTGGNDNTADGYLALRYNANGSWNTANGSQALFNNVNGNENVAS